MTCAISPPKKRGFIPKKYSKIVAMCVMVSNFLFGNSHCQCYSMNKPSARIYRKVGILLCSVIALIARLFSQSWLSRHTDSGGASTACITSDQ